MFWLLSSVLHPSKKVFPLIYLKFKQWLPMVQSAATEVGGKSMATVFFFPISKLFFDTMKYALNGKSLLT